jgi:hypothetical protein
LWSMPALRILAASLFLHLRGFLIPYAHLVDSCSSQERLLQLYDGTKNWFVGQPLWPTQTIKIQRGIRRDVEQQDMAYSWDIRRINTRL